MDDEHGPCWWCGEDAGEFFSWEFDTFYHEKCLKDRLKIDPEDPEARLIYREWQSDSDN
jgi:hypothetical protein